MKWVTVGLFALGTVAATCTAVLVASMGAEKSPAAPAETPDVSVVVAARDLQAMTVLDESCLVTRRVQPGHAPAGAFGDPLQVIGKVLTTPLQSGEAFAPAAFATDGSAMRLAAALPEGRRAVTVSLSDSLGGEGLLYPGCLVDVLVTMRMPAGESEQPVTITLLQGVSVLAVGPRTIVSPVKDESSKVEDVRRSDRPAVTLLVDGREAEMLKLAMEEGSVSMVLRNPRDLARPAAAGTDLAALSPVLAVAPAPVPEDRDDEEPAPPVLVVQRPLQRTWEAVVLRGGERETQTFELPAPTQP
jgi:pilus assembly protein CpaB